ncbi:kinase-like domain-containing protein [Aspergillus coremiiformis]|uniref:non-specific serine/threonine protein kinase n=1 Tax=Aspergillus coremiiformis TaxID=138285 RepID=A0A5N6Z3G3_9EURO|nr:kinase-like domain-containing protein [Aspergillus coremiiformis]
MESEALTGTSKVSLNVEYMPIDDVEKLERYCPGGYCPTTIGERLNNRYHVVHKLGVGSYSTVWLARDQEAGKYVSIKIAIASSEVAGSQESSILHRLLVADSEAGTHPGRPLISPILDEFTLSSPNGIHRCFVTVPGMMNLAEAKDASYIRLFQLPVARAIVAQLVQAVAFLHSRGIVHADLHAGNVLIRLPGAIDALLPEQLYKRFGQPRYEPVVRLDNRPLQDNIPSHIVVPIWLGKESENISLTEAQIILTDFGESFAPGNTMRYYSNTPDVLIPPEVYFEPQETLSFPADIWTLACTIWTVLGQSPLFEGFNPSVDWVLKEHVDTLGKLPEQWWLKWDSRNRWFNEDGSRHHGAYRRPWAQRFEDSVQKPRQESNMPEVGQEEKLALFAMLKAMLDFQPKERPTAREVMECEWMRTWALPELLKIRENQI